MKQISHPLCSTVPDYSQSSPKDSKSQCDSRGLSFGCHYKIRVNLGFGRPRLVRPDSLGGDIYSMSKTTAEQSIGDEIGIGSTRMQNRSQPTRTNGSADTASSHAHASLKRQILALSECAIEDNSDESEWEDCSEEDDHVGSVVVQQSSRFWRSLLSVALRPSGPLQKPIARSAYREVRREMLARSSRQNFETVCCLLASRAKLRCQPAQWDYTTDSSSTTFGNTMRVVGSE